jgi:hypothetical protein
MIDALALAAGLDADAMVDDVVGPPWMLEMSDNESISSNSSNVGARGRL